MSFVGPSQSGLVGVPVGAAVRPVLWPSLGRYEQVARGGPCAARERRLLVARVRSRPAAVFWPWLVVILRRL